MLFVAVVGVEAGSSIDQFLQFIGVRGPLHCRVQGDLAFVIERCQRLIESLHAILVLAGLHH